MRCGLREHARLLVDDGSLILLLSIDGDRVYAKIM